MALLLCHKEAKYPYYYESLDLSLYSMEELAYAVGQYLPLVPKDFVSPPLCRWIMDGLERKEVGEKLLQLYEMGEKEERVLYGERNRRALSGVEKNPCIKRCGAKREKGRLFLLVEKI